MRNKTSSIESLKTVLIVVLIISAILLLYFLWKNETFDELRTPIDIFQENQKPVISNPADFIVPKSMIVNIGTNFEGPYRSADDQIVRYWNSFINAFKVFSLSENIYFEEITKEQWEQAKELTSLTISFDYSISFVSLCSLFEINRPSAYNSIENVTDFLYSEASKESIIMYDQKNNKYYRLAAKQNTGIFSDIIREIDTSESREDYYYPISMPLGIEMSNTCLIPVSIDTNMQSVSYQTEISEDEDEKMREIAQAFFGKNFDFIRRIKETNHTTVFIYGYGEKLLTSRENGSFEYREEFSGGGTQESLHSALKITAQYIDNHGGLSELGKRGVSVYLQEVQNIEQQKRKGYRFIFGFKKDGMPIHYEDGDALVVEVIGSQVIYYKRYAILPEPLYKTNTDEKNAMQAVAVLLKNNANGSIREALTEHGISLANITDKSGKTNEIESLSIIADSIDNIQTGYFKTEQIDKLIPIWIFTVDTIDMYFDLYTGEMLGDMAKEAKTVQ